MPSRRVLPAVPVLLAIFLGTACGPDRDAPAGSLRVEIAVSPTPPTVGPARILVTVRDSAGSTVTGADVRVEAHDESGRAEGTPAPDAGDGRYAADGVRFGTPGRWVLEARARLPDGRQGSGRLEVRVVGPR